MRTVYSELKAIIDYSLEVCNNLDKGIVSVSPSFAGSVVRFKDNCTLTLEDKSVIVLPLVFVFSNKFLDIMNDKNLYIPSSLINAIRHSDHKTIFDNLNGTQCRNIRFTNQLQFDNYQGTYTMLNSPVYKLREKFRFWDGIYEELPHLEYLLDEDQLELVKEVFAHRSLEDKSKVAFTKTQELGDKDVQTVMKPGRFLKYLFPDIDNEICKKFSAAMIVLAADLYRINTSAYEHDFADIYMNSDIESCMSDGESKFTNCFVDGKFFHPTRVYALEGNGIEICWITDSVTGEIVGRCLLVDKSEYTRVYPTDDQARQNICHNVLEDSGYAYNEYALSGRFLRRVETHNGGIICPFIDPCMGVNVHPDYLEVGGPVNPSHERGMLVGYLGNDSFCSCDNCGEDIAEEYEVYHTANGLSVCIHCIESEYTLAFDAALGERGYYKTGNFVFYQINDMVRDIPIVNPYGGLSMYKVLSEVYYDEPLVAFHGDVVTDDDGESVEYEDTEELNIFLHPVTGLWCSRDDYAAVNGEVVEYPAYTADLKRDFRSQPYGLPGFLTE